LKPVIEKYGESFLYTCAFDKTYTYEQFVPEHLLAYQISGQTLIYHQRGEMVLEEGQFLIGRRNQFAKSIKVPAAQKEYQCISVIMNNDRLQQYARDNGIICEERYHGAKNILLAPNNILKGYFQSIIPYTELGTAISKKMAAIKVYEAIALVLEMRPDLEAFLFDFSDPHKQSLEEFMLKNYRYNAPIGHFAKLSGRSLTSFKREFTDIFNTSPGTWLKEKRLSEAYFLIKKKNRKPKDIYLDLGFENLSHFYTSFKQKYGMTPAEINQKNKL
jgi:AraC family transcriptional regulator, exoenzyme S synthesis regulatory protein ExsA